MITQNYTFLLYKYCVVRCEYNFFEYVAVGTRWGVGGRLNLPLQPNYFIFMGYFRKLRKIKPNPPSKSSIHSCVVQCFVGGVRGRFEVWVQFSATQFWAEVIMCWLHLMVVCNMGRSKTCWNIITCKWNLISVAQHPCLFRQNFSIENKGHWIGRCMVRTFLSCNTIPTLEAFVYYFSRHGRRGHDYHDFCEVLHFCKGLECINKWDYIADKPKIPLENLVDSRKKSKAT